MVLVSRLHVGTFLHLPPWLAPCQQICKTSNVQSGWLGPCKINSSFKSTPSCKQWSTRTRLWIWLRQISYQHWHNLKWWNSRNNNIFLEITHLQSFMKLNKRIGHTILMAPFDTKTTQTHKIKSKAFKPQSNIYAYRVKVISSIPVYDFAW